MRPLGQSAKRTVYTASFRRHVHLLVGMGYDRLVPPTYQTSEETAITGELVDAMRAAMAEVTAPVWVGHYTIHDDPPLSLGGRLGKHRQRVDIEFERVILGKRPRFQFEAKRLCDHSTDSDYCGENGLGCFLSGEYAPEHREAGMLGYVQTQDEPTWATRIKVRLQAEPKKFQLRPNGGWKRVQTDSGLSFTYRTRHGRKNKLGPITISHVLLRFH
jgi:hypothetical protein